MITDNESFVRLSAMLSTALGEHVRGYLTDPNVVEVMANPDGSLWVDRLGAGREFTGQMLLPESVERAIFIIATSIGAVCSAESPLLSAELSSFSARFQGVLPPVSPRPCFSVRKKASKVYALEDYVGQGVIRDALSKKIKQAVSDRKNI
ncbi:MAG TPA: P-type conjugative transfer ATPase TrbB, partial [Oligoflexia bacterium]|nr:P-type conjugative transfer ATPase TrbB [Oligoflexia bacterium]